jgi:hypothetical protein
MIGLSEPHGSRRQFSTSIEVAVCAMRPARGASGGAGGGSILLVCIEDVLSRTGSLELCY